MQKIGARIAISIHADIGVFADRVLGESERLFTQYFVIPDPAETIKERTPNPGRWAPSSGIDQRSRYGGVAGPGNTVG